MNDGCPISLPADTRAGDLQYFYIQVPAGAPQLTVSTSGGSGNADLYVSHSGWPSTTAYDASSTGAGNNESVTINAPVGGSYYYIAVAATAPFSGVSLVASTANAAPTPACTPGDGYRLNSGCAVSVADTPRAGDLRYAYIAVPAGTRSLRVSTSGGSGNADLYVSGSGWPSTSSYDARSTQAGNSESVTINNPKSGYYYIAVAATAPFSGVSVTATATP